jgi:hypothetical protein
MSRKTIVLLVLLFSAPVVIYLLLPSDKSRIRTLFREGAAAVEAKKLDDVMAKVSFSYSDEHGLTYFSLRKVFERIFSEMRRIKVEYQIKDIAIDGDRATADLDVKATVAGRQGPGYIGGDDPQEFHITFFLDKEHMKWLVVGTEGLPRDFDF